ncbi:hypothetical protein ACU8MI_26155 (plasmid) [Rhizobium leguminosarum]
MSAIQKKSFPKDWPAIEVILANTPTADDWAFAFEVCLKARIQSRYLAPISELQNGPYQGEGFTILTIQCALIEFLAALRLGWNYRLGTVWGQNNEYSQTKDLYTNFLVTEAPFSAVVTSRAEALTFYKDVRCALVHEAQTKNQWKVWAGNAGSSAIDFQRLYVNRDLLQRLIDSYVADYGVALTGSVALQEAFMRKFQYIYSHS